MPARSDRPCPRPSLEELARAERVLDACGLRFDGYAYAESRAGRDVDAGEWLAARRDAFTRALQVPEAVEGHGLESPCDAGEEAHAVLFAFQRGAKDHGWFLDRSAGALAGPMLFLHLYVVPVPERWRLANHADSWDRLSPEDREEAAGIVRRWLGWGDERWGRR